jgi:hypothetical protein
MAEMTTGAGKTVVWGLAAALVLTGGAAAYATMTAVGLRDEVRALRATVSGAEPPAKGAPGVGVAGAATAPAPGGDSIVARLAATEAKVAAHERTIEDLSTLIAGLAGMSDKDVAGLEIGPDGEATGPAAAKLRAFLKAERLRDKREGMEKMAAHIDETISARHAKFVEDHGLDAAKDKALAELEADVNEKARALAESVMSGDKMWWEIRPEIRALFDDSTTRLNGLLGDDMANDYLDRIAEDFPMLNRWRRGGGGAWGDPGAAGTGAPGAAPATGAR